MSETKSVPAKAPLFKNKQFWLIVVWVLFFLLWFMPTPEGLTVAGKHAMAVVVLTIGMWLTKAVPPAVGSMIMLGIVSVFMRSEIEAATLFKYWTQETMWFIITCFAFAAIMKKSGLGHRLSTIVFSIKNPLLLNFAILVLSFIFSLVGMAASLPKLTLLFPILVSIATLSGLDKDNTNVRRIAVMINLLANTTGVLLYTGFSLNPTLGTVGGFDMNYTLWLKEVMPLALAGNLLLFFVIYFMYMPRKSEAGFDHEKITAMRKELPAVSGLEWKAIVWFLIAIAFWATGGKTHIGAGFATLLVVGLMCLPKIGIISFKEFADSVNWPTVFMIMGVLAFGAMGSTGFTKWLVQKIMPATLPSSPMVCLLIICFLIELFHIALGSIGTSMALLVPVMVSIAPSIGIDGKCMAIVTYMCIVFQSFFPYQNVAFVAGLSYNLWEEKDLLKTGIVLFFLVPLLFAVVMYPFYTHMGWIL